MAMMIRPIPARRRVYCSDICSQLVNTVVRIPPATMMPPTMAPETDEMPPK